MSIMRFGRHPIGLVGFAFVAALVVSACAGSSRTPRIVVITLPPAPVTAAPAASGGATGGDVAPAAVSNVLITSAAPDGKWKVTFKKPLVTGLPDAVNSKINDAITGQVNGYVAAFSGRQDLPAVAKDASPSQLEGDYAIALNSSSVVSFRFTQLVWLSGQDHPTGTPGSVSFAVSSGKALTLADLFAEPAKAVGTIAMKTHSALVTTLGTELTWDGKATSLDFFSKAWAITAAGLEFSWPQGQIASSAGGMPSATVAWADLASLLKPGSAVASLVK